MKPKRILRKDLSVALTPEICDAIGIGHGDILEITTHGGEVKIRKWDPNAETRSM